jgi:hypothetical protein
MNTDQSNESFPVIYNQQSISFPLDEDAFREFITSLLGQPDVVEGLIEGSFEIEMGGFEHLDHIINHRIESQNQASLLEFRAKLFFDNESSMSFNGIQSFTNYKEQRPLICEGFIFTWSYLIKFNNKQVSEKQEISIFSVPGENSLENKDESKDLTPRIDYSIRCTDKGWGIEIAELIRNCLLGFIRTNSSPINKLRKLILENFELVKYSLFFLTIVAMSWFSSIQTDPKLKECRILASQADKFIKANISSNEKLDFIAKIVSLCMQKDSPSFLYIFLLTIAPLVAVIFGPNLIYRFIKFPDYRFLIFTEHSKRQRDKYFRKINEQRTFWIVTILISLIIGILGNYIFTWLSHLFR